MRTLKTNLAALLLIFAAGLFFASTIRHGHAWTGDFAMYVMHSRNLAEGKPYADTCYVFNAKTAYLGPVAYPPGFPVLLAPVYKLFGPGLTAMKYEIIVFYLLFLWFCHLLFAKQLPPAYALCLTGILAFNPVYWDYKDYVYSEFLFMAFLYACLWLAAAERRKETRSFSAQLCIGILAYLCYSTRVPGIVLIPALLVDDLLVRRKSFPKAPSNISPSPFSPRSKARCSPVRGTTFSKLKTTLLPGRYCWGISGCIRERP